MNDETLTQPQIFVFCCFIIEIEKEKARRIPYVEKIQLVLKLQCEALIRLGFDDSVKVQI